MNRREHLLTILAEECAELAQRASKALRFGLDEVQPGQALTNAERMQLEMADLLGVWLILSQEELLSPAAELHALACGKREKIERFLVYSRELGTLKEQQTTMNDDSNNGVSSPPADAMMLTGAAVADLLSVSSRTLWRLVKAGKFPPPVCFNRKLVRWKAAEVRAAVEAMK